MSETTDSSSLRELVVRLCFLAAGVVGGTTLTDASSPPAELIWCCDGTDGGCVTVEAFGDCPDGNLLFYCEWGQSTEASGANGESGWECLEQ